MSSEGEWEPVAEQWVRWARTPGHDAYWYYRDAFFDQVVPAAGRCTIEVGCGEGRVARDLSSRGHRVVGVDTSVTLLRYAGQEDPGGRYLLAESAALPFPDECCDVVVAYNSLQDVADMPGTVREVARLLRSGGRFCVCISHPVTDMGRFPGDDPTAPFTLHEAYFQRRRVDDTVRHDGLTMRFLGWTYSLEDYARAFEEAGLCLELLREPRPEGADLPASYERWRQVPLFLFARAVKLS